MAGSPRGLSLRRFSAFEQERFQGKSRAHVLLEVAERVIRELDQPRPRSLLAAAGGEHATTKLDLPARDGKQSRVFLIPLRFAARPSAPSRAAPPAARGRRQATQKSLPGGGSIRGAARSRPRPSRAASPNPDVRPKARTAISIAWPRRRSRREAFRYRVPEQDGRRGAGSARPRWAARRRD